MALKMTNEVSLVDLFAIGGLLAGALAFFFGYGVTIQENHTSISHIKSDMVRLERVGEARDTEILEQLKEQRDDLKEIRTESMAGRKDIIGKLDKLIDRELDAK